VTSDQPAAAVAPATAAVTAGAQCCQQNLRPDSGCGKNLAFDRSLLSSLSHSSLFTNIPNSEYPFDQNQNSSNI